MQPDPSLLAALGPFSGWLAGALTAVVVLGVLVQLLFCYTIQVVADKLELPAPWLAWVPILQLHPFVRAGDGSLLHGVVWLASGLALALVAALLGSLLGPTLGVPLLLGWALWGLLYFARILAHTAAARGLSPWVGILCLVPGLGLLLYPLIAFHDGLRPPHAVGVVLGLVFYALPALPSLREVAQLGEVLRLVAEGDGVVGSARRPDAPNGQALAAPTRTATPAELPVPEWRGCPPGSEERGAASPRGSERWCERHDPALGRVRHGLYTAWYPDGTPRESGAYRDGRRQGVWTRWYTHGGRQAQAEFVDGHQHGWLLTWDELGRKDREIRFRDGEPAG